MHLPFGLKLTFFYGKCMGKTQMYEMNTEKINILNKSNTLTTIQYIEKKCNDFKRNPILKKVMYILLVLDFQTLA